jgi:threonine/homoserine/homoserine lactone efflux protein
MSVLDFDFIGCLSTPLEDWLIYRPKLLLSDPAMDLFGIHHYGLFIVSGLLLNITPGQDTLYILGRSLAQGRQAGVLSVLGIGTGCLIHTLAAATGLSAVLAASSQAFFMVKLLGGGYLIYLGLQMVVSKNATFEPVILTPSSVTRWKIYRQSVLTNVLNPKVALFFLAFLPQFIELGSRLKAVAFVILGLTFIGTGTLWCLCLVEFASFFSQRLRQSSSLAAWLGRIAGALFIALGVKLAFR